MSRLLRIITFPPPSVNTSSPLFASPPLKRLSRTVSNTGFSFVESSGRPLPVCCCEVEIFPATQRISYYKTATSTQILTFSTLAPSSSFPCSDITPNPSTTTPQLPSIALVTGGYRFSRGRTNQKSHETHGSCSSIRPLVSKIFTRTAVSFPTGMQPPRRHSTTTRGGKTSSCGALSRFVAT